MTKAPSHALHTFMDQVTQEMASEYRRIYEKSAEDPGTAGDEGEENWATLLREWLPPYYHVRTKGRLLSYNGDMSKQVDVLVLKPSYPRKLLEKHVWLADGVIAAFECKNTLKAHDVSAAVSRCAEFKNLCRPRDGTPLRELRSPLIYGLLAHSYVWKNKNSKPIDNINNALWDAEQAIQEPRSLLDILCVADLANWSRMHSPYYAASWLGDPAKVNALRAHFGGEYGPTSSMVCASTETQTQADVFRPIGAFVSILTNLITWQDVAARDLADYYRLASMWGAGSGQLRFWPSSILSQSVHGGIAAGKLVNGATWNEWSFSV